MKDSRDRCLVIRPGARIFTEAWLDQPDHKDIEKLIGAGFSDAFHVPGRVAYRLYGWCNDTGAYDLALPMSVLVDTTIFKEEWPIRGPLVITACDEFGNTVSITHDDILAFRLLPPRPPFTHPGGKGYMGPVPPSEVKDVPVLTYGARSRR